MDVKEQQLRQLVRELIKKTLKEVKEDKQADAEWVVDKIATALDAATNSDKDYQYAAVRGSKEFNKLAQDIKDKKKDTEDDELLKETFLDWLASGARSFGRGIIDRRAGYLTQAMKHDPKLQRMAKDAGLSPAALEKKIYSMIGRDTNTLKAIVNFRLR